MQSKNSDKKIMKRTKQRQWGQHQNEANPKIGNDSKNLDNFKKEVNPKKEHDINNKDSRKNEDDPKNKDEPKSKDSPKHQEIKMSKKPTKERWP